MFNSKQSSSQHKQQDVPRLFAKLGLDIAAATSVLQQVNSNDEEEAPSRPSTLMTRAQRSRSISAAVARSSRATTPTSTSRVALVGGHPVKNLKRKNLDAAEDASSGDDTGVASKCKLLASGSHVVTRLTRSQAAKQQRPVTTADEATKYDTSVIMGHVVHKSPVNLNDSDVVSTKLKQESPVNDQNAVSLFCEQTSSEMSDKWLNHYRVKILIL